MTRKTDGRETWHALLAWDKGQSPTERLAGVLLNAEGYESIDPSHPLGGKDGGKDLQMTKDGLLLIGAVYFPRGQQSFTEIKNKFKEDLKGVAQNNKQGIVFFTNQELRLSERNELQHIGSDKVVEIYHLERITLLLNTPSNYGIRTEFLDIDMTNEELVALYAQRDAQHLAQLSALSDRLENISTDLGGYVSGGDSFPEFKFVLNHGNNNINVLALINGKYPLYEVKINLRMIDSGGNAHLDRFVNMHNPQCIYPALTNSYAQLVLDFPAPITLPVKFHLSAFARSGVFYQSISIDRNSIGRLYSEKSSIFRSNGVSQELLKSIPESVI